MVDDAVHPDLWAKVAAFDRCCHVLMTRVGDRAQPKRWRVAIIKGGDSVTAEDATLPRALTAAVLGADARGWGAAPPPAQQSDL